MENTSVTSDYRNLTQFAFAIVILTCNLEKELFSKASFKALPSV
jgi:hypothetical protein